MVLASGMIAVSAGAVGLGANVDAGYGHASWSFDNQGIETINRDSACAYVGGGLVFDTAVERNTLFNYRLNLGIDQVSYPDFILPEYYFATHFIPAGDLEMTRYKLVNSFGFGLVRTEGLRFWLGPQLLLSYAQGSETTHTSHLGYTYTREDDFSMAGAGLGLVLGLNINTPGVVTVALEFGARVNVLYGTDDYRAYGGIWDSAVNGFTQVNPEAFLNATLLFRMGEHYEKKP
jgi:hypothetical protein